MSLPPPPTRGLRVLEAGAQCLVQDRGRPGHAAYGVGPSGAADRGSAELANRLVGNAGGAAVLECLLGGLVVQAVGAVTVAVTGARAAVAVDGRPEPANAPIALPDNAILSVGLADDGLRVYLSARGGVVVEPVLGSRSRDVFAALGPPPVSPGDVLPVGPSPRRWPLVDLAVPPGSPESRRRPAPERLAALAGPHQDAVDGGLEGLEARIWTVAPDSDRTGVRLSGPPLSRRPGEWPVEGLARGAVQLPPSGQPVLLGADHPVTGGYPVVGVLDPASSDRAAQLRPGDLVQLRLR